MSDMNVLSVESRKIQENVSMAVLKESISQPKDAMLATLLESTVVPVPDPEMGNKIDLTA